ncbi:MAG: DUF4410 domain-containing protein [Candidatus Binataceae bacterium]
MRARIHNQIYIFLVLVLAGCAGSGSNAGGIIAGATASAPQAQAAPITNGRPSQIMVFPFATSTADVTLNQGLGARLYRNYSGEDETAAQTQLAQSTAQDICIQVATSLANNGWNAACQPRGTPVTGTNTLIVDGDFTDISEGNRLQRVVIGLGVGKSVLDTSVGLYQYSSGNSTQLLTFTTHADSGKMPGVAITAPAGAATGGAAAAATIGVSVASTGVKNITSSTAYLSKKTAQQVVDQMNNYFSQQGWNSTTPGS